MSPELEKALARTVKLFKTRDRSEDWSRNIIEGSEGITDTKDWTLYYHFLSNPKKFDPSNVCTETLDPDIEIPLPKGHHEVFHKNGPDYIIEVKRNDDEKSE